MTYKNYFCENCYKSFETQTYFVNYEQGEAIRRPINWKACPSCGSPLIKEVEPTTVAFIVKRKQVLDILKELEHYRRSRVLEKNNQTIITCQALIARRLGYTHRDEWLKLIKTDNEEE